MTKLSLKRKMNDLNKRIFDFIVRVIKFLKTLENTPEMKVIRYQLVKSSSSTGANYEEAQGAGSRADFSNKVRISLKEIRESNFWLRLIKAVAEVKNEELNYLIKESSELKKILGSIASKTRNNENR